MRVTLLDYGAGNLHSLAKALAGPGRSVILESDPRAALVTDCLVLPGVGAFGAAAARLAPARDTLRAALADGLPCLGICLGMQLLFERSEEGPGCGVGQLAGVVTRLAAERTPQLGWNEVTPDPRPGGEPLLRASGLRTGYYANRYACRPADAGAVTAWTTCDRDRFPAMIRAARTVGIQFHPEKSSAPGVRLVRAFLESAGTVP